MGKFLDKLIGKSAQQVTQQIKGDEEKVNAVVEIAKKSGLVQNSRMMDAMRRGSFKDICRWVKEKGSIPTVDELMATVEPSFIKMVGGFEITVDDIRAVISEHLKDATIAKFKRYI